MIHRLEIENFYSIRETQVIDLRIGAKVPDEEGRFDRLRDESNVRVPKALAFFGANASGKSNVLRALAFLRWFLVDSVTLPLDASLPDLRFADGNALPTRIKVQFDWSADPWSASPKKSAPFAQYIYEVTLGGAPGQSTIVLSEELRLQPATGKSRRIFVRTSSGEVEGGAGFSLRGFGLILTNLRPNVGVASAVAQLADRQPAAGLLAWAKGLTSNILAWNALFDERNATKYYAENPEKSGTLIRVIQQLDTGIMGMTLRDTANGLQPEFIHQGLGRQLALASESEGTRQYYRIHPIIWETLEHGGIAVVDEMDSKIHPMILPAILRWFYDPFVNLGQAQLWMSGHSASLLEDLKKEEIFFTEKDPQGRTSIYGLKDIESVRRSDNFYQKYLGGVYGAVPRSGGGDCGFSEPVFISAAKAKANKAMANG
jgi:hypothetical protein